MKKILSLILVMAMMAALFTGCGCAANVSTHPGGMITEEATRPSVMPTPTATHETTRPIPPATSSDPTTQSPMDTTGVATTPTDSTTRPMRPDRNTDR